MSHLIDKDALVAEIEKRKGICDKHYGDYWNGCYNTFTDILSFIDTIEVEEVDLDVMQRMKECPYRQVGCTMYEGKILECKGACSWVVDYQKLKDLKHRK